MNNLRIIFMGTPEFAVESLDILIKNNYTIVAVVTAPDKPAGRGQQIQQSAVKQYATKKGLNILQPEKLKDDYFLNQLRELKSDLQIIVAFRMLPEVVWRMPRLGTFNLHGSLLPQYRGAAPINWAIINGEKETGVSTFFLQHTIDTGKIIFREKLLIGENDTAGKIHDELMVLGAQLVLKTVQGIEQNNYPQIDQTELIIKGEKEKHAPKILKEHCSIDWNKDTNAIHNFIRGLSPYPSAFSNLTAPDQKVYPIKIFKTEKEITPHLLPLKTIVTDSKNYLKIAVSDGFVSIMDVQLAGKKRMYINEFLRGFSINGQWNIM